MKLSVIVTVYNREKYLARCLDSILCQDLDEYEIIVIDDGSSDGSWPMIENYRERYPEKIQGVSSGERGRLAGEKRGAFPCAGRVYCVCGQR